MSTCLKPVVALSTVLLLQCGCKSGPLYRPYDGQVGYSETQLAPDTWEISFNGSSRTAPSYATHLAIVRAAEIATEYDRPYFRIENVNRHDLIRTRHEAGSTQTHHYTDKEGKTRSYTTHTPSSTITHTTPVSTLIVKLLHAPVAGSFETIQMLQNAQREQTPLNAQSLEWLRRRSPAAAEVTKETEQ